MPGIAYVFQDQYPWDVRAEKIVESVSAAGYPTVLISRNRTGTHVSERIHDRLEIQRLPKGWNGFTRSLLNFPAFFSPVWIFTIANAVRRRGLDLIIVRDLPLAPAAIIVGRMTKTPVLMDMAEDYPAMISDTWTYRGPERIDYVLRNPSLLKMLERWTLPRMDGILVVSDASADRVHELVVRSRTQVWVVGNTPRLNADTVSAESIPVTRKPETTSLRLLYVGGLEEVRGLDIMIRAIALLIERSIRARLVICGRGPHMEQLRSLAEELGVIDLIDFAGWIDPKDVPTVIELADICVVPHYVTAHTDTTLPNKIYDYMLHAKPVIVTHSRTLRAVVESRDCGLSYRDKSPEGLAHAIEQLVDPEVRLQLGRRGRAAVLDELNWSHDETRLLEAVKNLIGIRVDT